MHFIFWTITGVIALIFGWIVLAFNSLVGLKNKTKGAWSDVDVQLKRRYNIIPNLVEAVRGYAIHEKEVFDRVVNARTKALSAKNPLLAAGAEKEVALTLRNLYAVVENYPNLRASENFRKLQEDLADTENKIQAARRFYNGNVRDFNTKQEQFPYNILAGLFGFKKAEFFEIEDIEEKGASKISL